MRHPDGLDRVLANQKAYNDMNDCTVIVPQFPTRMGEDGPVRMPLDLTDAERYGHILEVLGPTAKPFDPDSLDELDLTMTSSRETDWLLAIGNPTLIAAAAGAFASMHGCLNVLQWQSRKGRYEAIRIEYTEEGTSLEVVTLPEHTTHEGEDDEHHG